MKNLSVAPFVYITIAGSTASCAACTSLLDAFSKSILLLFLASATCLHLVKSSAASRHLLWATTMLGILLIPICNLLLPEWHILPTWNAMEKSKVPVFVSDVEGNVPPPMSLMEKIDKESVPFGRLGFEFEPSKDSYDDGIVRHSIAKSESYTESWKGPLRIRISASIVILVWATGATFALLPMILSLFRLRRLETNPFRKFRLSPRIRGQINSLCSQLGISVPRIVLGPVDAMPMVWSLGRSRLLLPLNVDKWSPAKLNAVLLHELVHLRRHDPAICALARLACSLNWFNPVAWYAFGRLQLECEQACDDHVLRLGVDANDYAGHLLELSTGKKIVANAGALAIAMASKPFVEMRIISVLNEKQNRSAVTVRRALATLIAGAIFAVLFARVATFAASNTAIEKADDSRGIDTTETAENASAQDHVDDQILEYLDLKLEECIRIALENTDLVKVNASSDQQKSLPSSARAIADVQSRMGTSELSAGELFNGKNEFPLLKSNDQIGGTESSNKAISYSNAYPPHPLSRGRDTAANRAPIVVIRTNSDISGFRLEDCICNLARDVEFAYWDLYAAFDRVNTTRNALDRATRIHKSFAARSANDDKLAKAAVCDFQAELDTALNGNKLTGEIGLLGCEQKLRFLIGRDGSDRLLIRPTDKPAISNLVFDWESVKAETLSFNISLCQHELEVKHKELELTLARTQALPDSNFDSLYRMLGVGFMHQDQENDNTSPVSEKGAASERLMGGTYEEGGIRFEHTLNSLGSRPRFNDITMKKLNFARALQLLEAKRAAALNHLNALLIAKDLHQKQMTEQFPALNAARELAFVAKVKVDSTDANPYFALDNWIRAEKLWSRSASSFIRSVVDYNNTLVEIHHTKGSLLAYNGIQLRL